MALGGYDVMAQILILAVGQGMRRDDGAGLAAVSCWQQKYQSSGVDSNIQVEFVDLPGLGLLQCLEGAKRVLIVDAVRSGAAAGSLHWLGEKDLAVFSAGSDSAHGWGVAETLVLGRKLNPEKMPSRVDFLGIEAGEVALGYGLSEAVAAVMEEAAEAIEKWIRRMGDRG